MMVGGILRFHVSRMAKTQSNQSTMVGEILGFKSLERPKTQSNQSTMVVGEILEF